MALTRLIVNRGKGGGEIKKSGARRLRLQPGHDIAKHEVTKAELEQNLAVRRDDDESMMTTG